MSEASDEFKIDILSSVKPLSKKFPSKYNEILHFLSSCLKNRGQQEFKSAVVSCIEELMAKIPKAKEAALLTLVDFIEDCQFPSLHIQIMNLIARESDKIVNHAKFIRLINNRVVLENSDIRAAAVTTLGKFALAKHELIPQIKYIIEK